MKTYLIDYENGVQQTKNYFTNLEYQEKIVPVKNEILELHKQGKFKESDNLVKVLKKFTGEYFIENSPMGIALNSNVNYMLLPNYTSKTYTVRTVVYGKSFEDVISNTYIDTKAKKKYYLKFKSCEL